MKKVVSRYCPDCSREFGPDEQISVSPVDHCLLAVIYEDSLAKGLIADRYRMIGVIGEGAWSTAYKAKDIKLNRPVAVKLQHGHLAGSAVPFQRFQPEAESAAQLAHINVVVTYDYGMIPEGQPYIAMEFLQGRSLQTVLNQEGRLPYQKLIDFMLPVCEGMHATHEKGPVHRDLKPGNIFITRDARAIRW
jgi:serine/threonine protein kinase